MAKIDYAVRILVRDKDGDLEDHREEYSLADLGNTVPAPGDLIVSPWYPSREHSLEPGNRKICEVKDRYFMPENIDEDKGGYIYIGLVVEVRKAMESERAIIRT